jgi:tetratricopeptide (TPR) repeat protein
VIRRSLLHGSPLGVNFVVELCSQVRDDAQKGDEGLKTHPTDLHLEALYLELGADHRKVLDHLAGCARCRERVAELRYPKASLSKASDMPDMPESPSGEPPDPHVFPFSLLLLQERAEAADLLVDLLRQPASRREAFLRADLRFRTWGLVELVVARSLEATTQDPDHAEELGRLALTGSSLLDAGFYGTEPIEGLRARAWGHIANARRVRSDLDGAEQGFISAKEHLQRGTQDPLEIALLLDLEGSLRRAQRRFGEAARLFQKAAGIFLNHGDPHRSGRSLFKLSTVQYFTGDLDEALATLRRSLEHLDLEREPRLRLCARHNLAFYLTDVGRFEEALAVYRETRPLYREFPEPWTQNRRKWVRARILRGLGQPRLAESLLLAVRDGFLAEDVPFDTALVSLEMAALYAEQGRTGELKRLAKEMIPVFSSLHIHREALAALSYLLQAIQSESVSATLVAAVASYLRQAEHDPSLPFRAPEP